MRLYDFENDDIVYDIDETKKTVTARVTCPVNVKKLCCTTIIGKMLTFVIAMRGTNELPEISDYFEATARCKPTEVFNVEKGKHIARLKLIKRVLKYEYNFMYAVRTEFREYTEKCEQEITHNIRYRGSSISNIIDYLSKE